MLCHLFLFRDFDAFGVAQVGRSPITGRTGNLDTSDDDVPTSARSTTAEVIEARCQINNLLPR
jgi:hypothetical protein